MIGIGIIGYGYWGPNLSRCVADTEGCFVAAIGDLSPKALAKAAKRHPTARLATDWKQVINDPTVDAVMVATPVEAHFHIALAALQAGKHVLVEKPITPTSREAEILIAEAKARKVVLMVDHTYVYTSAVRKIRDLVVAGEVGDIYYYDSTRVNLGLFQHDVNVIWDLAVHDLAILDFLLGEPPVAVSANGANHVTGGPDNMAYITLYFENGVIAHVNVNWLAPVKIRQTVIGGSRRMIVYDDLQPSEKVKIYDRGVNLVANESDRHKMRVSYRMGDMWCPEISVKEALATEMEHFVACVRQEATPMTSGESGLRVVRALEAATISLRKHGHPVELINFKEAS